MNPQLQNPISYVANNPVKYLFPSVDALETFADIAFTAYSGYLLIDAITNGGNVREAAVNFSLDAGSSFVPFVPAAGTIRRAAGKANELTGSQKLTSNQIGKQGEELVDSIIGPGQRQVTYNTPWGDRRTDIKLPTSINEVKNTRLYNTRSNNLQAMKDQLISAQQQVDAIWHLLKGGSPNAIKNLLDKGITVVDHQAKTTTRNYEP